MKRALLLTIVLVFLFLLPTAAVAQYPPTVGDLVIDKTVVEPGESVRVSGGGFCPGTQVTVTLVPTGSTTGAPRALGTFTTDASGNFAGSVIIPTDTPPGTYTLQATGQSSDCVATRVLSANLTVRAAQAAVARGPRGFGAVTGIEALPWVVGGLAVIGLGTGMVVISRRRSRAPLS
ncbi:MAG: hypothetical protein KY429_07685 [Actinobacteria bacterium]|nr:hypothetical protein [Actinomycetota bacterium]